eukprot:6615007-Alexandrium_andersonii.AAC.1
MSASLVGSEMCIRDSWLYLRGLSGPWWRRPCHRRWSRRSVALVSVAVSYTHLTLPTICSV